MKRRDFLFTASGLAAAACATSLPALQKPANPQERRQEPAPPPRKNDPYHDAVLKPGEPDDPEPDSITLIALPDTQNYSQNPRLAHHFFRQTEWIAENASRRRIAGVLHLGDITNNNTEAEWEVAAKALKTLEGVVPLCLTPGNHDYSENGSAKDRSSRFSTWFPADRLSGLPGFGGFYDREPERVENSFHLLDTPERKLLVLCLEFGPRRDVIRWANEVVARHPDREAILVTHAFTYFDDSRYDHRNPALKQSWNPHDYPLAKPDGDVTDGEELWQELVSRHPNFIFTINGHVLGDGLGRMTSQTPDGRSVHQMLVNFQMRPEGGDGWLRLLELRRDGTLKVCDYSPSRNERNESPQNRFELPLSPLRS